MMPIRLLAFVALPAGLAIASSALAQETETTTTETTTTYTTPPQPVSNAPAMNTTTSSTVTERDEVSLVDLEHDKKPRLRPGFGLNVFGAAGTKDAAAWGLGGRLEFVMPFGLTIGGSYQQSFNRTSDKTSVRPLLGEIGVAIPVARVVDVRPMVGLGSAFVSTSGDTTVNAGGDGQVSNATVATAGFADAPGAKHSYPPGGDAPAYEVYTMPTYHFISGSNFFGMELGAGARF
jgi:hypothetical protein